MYFLDKFKVRIS